MAKKEYIGIALSGNNLKIAHVRVKKGRLQLLSADTVALATPLRIQSPTAKAESEEIEQDDTDSVFGFDDDPDTPETDLMSDMDDESSISIDDDMDTENEFDMTEESSDIPGGGSNEGILEAVLSGINRTRVDIGLNIPSGNTIFQLLTDNDYESIKKKERSEIIEERLNSIYDKPISSDNYAFQIRDDKSLLLASFENEIPLLNTLDQAATYYKGKVFIREIHADESVLVGLVRANYILNEEEYTGIIHIGEQSSRIIFLKGNIIYMVMPLIDQGSNSPRILNTVFSKMLFEIDKGDLPNIDRLIITNHGGLGDKVVDFFRKQLKDVEIENLSFHPDKFMYPDNETPDEELQDLSSYSTAIGMAWVSSGLDAEAFPGLSFVPRHVHDRQRVFKLEWHGVLILMMIAGVPFMVNKNYQENRMLIQELENEVRLIDNQINETRPIATITEQLAEENGLLEVHLDLINTLSENSQKWSTTLGILNNGLRSVQNTWVTTLRSANEGLILEGYSLYRNRIPRLANVFHKATVQSVREGEMRGRTIYRFVILVDEIVEDTDRFTPYPVAPPEDLTRSITIDPVRTSGRFDSR